MGKWIITVDDKDDVEMSRLARTMNCVFLGETYGESVIVDDMEQATLGDVE